MINNFFAHACSVVNDNELEKRCSINGYVSQFQVYVGTETSAETCLGARVVKDLTQNLVGKHHHIFCGNFFTSVKLFTELHEVGVYATGTLRADRRGFPHDIKGSAKKGFKKKGECKICRSRLDTNLSGKTQNLSLLAPSRAANLWKSQCVRYAEQCLLVITF